MQRSKWQQLNDEYDFELWLGLGFVAGCVAFAGSVVGAIVGILVSRRK